MSGGDVKILQFDTPLEINNAGQMVFSARLVGSKIGKGIFFYDDNLGLLNVIQEGDSFLGSAISRYNFSGDTTSGGERSGFNDLGQLAFQFVLADGRSGIAVWSPVPEPASVRMLALGGVVLLSRRCHFRAIVA